jgi:cytochrome b561
MGPLSRLEPRPAVVDWSILLLVTFEVGSGLVSLTAGTPDWAWLFWAHGIAGVSLVALLGWKFRRVLPRVRRRDRWDGGTPVSILLATVAVTTLALGITWASVGNVVVGGTSLLTIHMVLGVATVPLVLWHLRHRFRLPRRSDVEGRRTTIQYATVLAAGALAWRLQGTVGSALDWAGAERRFTGSKETASDEANAYPVTSWVADDPDPIDPAEWELTIGGAVERPRAVSADVLDPSTETRATLDCTGGWYSVHDWQGVRVGALLDAAEPAADARWVRFVSVTGYRWSLPIEEARDALLATHVDGQRLTHGHGFPARLVAPGRRGFQWVKWVERIELRRTRDPGQWLAIFVSGLDEK